MTQQDFKHTVFILKDKMFRFAKRMLACADEWQDAVQKRNDKTLANER